VAYFITIMFGVLLSYVHKAGDDLRVFEECHRRDVARVTRCAQACQLFALIFVGTHLSHASGAVIGAARGTCVSETDPPLTALKTHPMPTLEENFCLFVTHRAW
jgi:hypothetical protein